MLFPQSRSRQNDNNSVHVYSCNRSKKSLNFFSIKAVTRLLFCYAFFLAQHKKRTTPDLWHFLCGGLRETVTLHDIRSVLFLCSKWSTVAFVYSWHQGSYPKSLQNKDLAIASTQGQMSLKLTQIGCSGIVYSRVSGMKAASRKKQYFPSTSRVVSCAPQTHKDRSLAQPFVWHKGGHSKKKRTLL